MLHGIYEERLSNKSNASSLMFDMSISASRVVSIFKKNTISVVCEHAYFKTQTNI